MRIFRFTDEEISNALKHAASESEIEGVCWSLGISEQTFHRWRSSLGGLTPSEVGQILVMEEQNRKLKQLVDSLSVAQQIVQDVLDNSFQACRQRAI